MKLKKEEVTTDSENLLSSSNIFVYMNIFKLKRDTAKNNIVWPCPNIIGSGYNSPNLKEIVLNNLVLDYQIFT